MRHAVATTAAATTAPDAVDSRQVPGIGCREGVILLVEATATPSRTPLGQLVIDCDIHNAVPDVRALFPYFVGTLARIYHPVGL